MSMCDLMVFYGDDFTGSTDVLLQYQRYGMEGIIFLGSPTIEDLRRAREAHQVIGVAGITRALEPESARDAIEPVFRHFQELEPRFVQYKVCSTADSSPNLGSFGPAVEAGRRLWEERPVPVLVAQPGLGRYTVFGTHFAEHRSEVFRLDRHPVMRHHPATPINEADLTVHLADQIKGSVQGMSVTDLAGPDVGAGVYARATDAGASAVVIDAITHEDLRKVGQRLLDDSKGDTLFAVGSGGLSVAMATALGHRRVQEHEAEPAMGPCLAVSGSCSQVTSDQIAYALTQGWIGVHLDLQAKGADYECVFERARDKAIAALRSGKSVVVYSFDENGGKVPEGIDGLQLSAGLASVVRASREATEVNRVIVAGGDTSGHVVTALGAKALRSKGVVGKEALLCEVESSDRVTDRLEVVLKGGQIGEDDFFETVRHGNSDA